MQKRQFSFLRRLPLTQQAVDYAADHHDGQRREADGALVLLHLLEVAALLDRCGCPDRVVAAAVLHDVLEDTDAGRRELDLRFGADVGAVVSLVSDDPGIGDEETRKDDVRERVREAGGDAALVYAADKISKVRELRLGLASTDPGEGTDAKLRRYRKSLEMLEQCRLDDRLVEALRFELEALEAFPPAANG